MTARILVVENDAIARQDIAEVLSEAGYLVEQAGNGREALDRLHARALRPALILLDLRTPEMNGWDFCSELRADRGTSDIPVVLVSGDPDVAGHSRRLGVVGYLRKPFGLDQLLAIVASTVAG